MRTIANIFTKVAERYLPDAFIFVFFLTFIVFALGLLKGYQPNQVLDFWGEGFFDILRFTAQATLMLVTGFALAHTPIVNKILVAFAKFPRNEVQIIALTTLVMMVCSWFSWGFGLIAGAIVAREMGIVHRDKIHYPLVVAASYAGFIVWHAGYGGAIPTLIATEGHFLESAMGVIPVSQTIFSINTLIILFALVLIIPLTMVMMRPRANEERRSIPESEISFEEQDPDVKVDKKTLTPAQRIERSRIVPLLLGAVGCIWLAQYFITGGAVNLNIVIMTFFALGLLFTHSTMEYITYFTGGAKSAYGIIMQFPFYAGIMGIMIHTGLAADIASMFVAIANENTLPFWGFISAGIVNMFVPSGGGQWAVQGPIMVEAASQLNADISRVAMGVAWGDAWTNMLQPFWTLPLLAIAGLGIRDIMGYTAVVLIVSGFVIGGGLLFL
ncbi:short-chain fatty acid transporter [Halomonas cerina]|uniref:Short-chain fatty acids transporter n=1 Tax=Halomonas cerina TaxID=447424 RepID=A0A839V6L4_9GAMM|nr:TIGR00366 family protein [Halomonas cerina]MBB3189658.1 short-chain fatty acids transporter [Halomonas cerina]